MKHIATILILVTIAGCMGCSRKTVYVPVEATRTVRDSLRSTAIHEVSEATRDSVIVYQRGDTVRIREVRWYARATQSADTVTHVRVDSVPVPVPVPYPVEVPAPAELSKWQRWQLSSWPWMAGAALALLVWVNRRRLLMLLCKIIKL